MRSITEEQIIAKCYPCAHCGSEATVYYWDPGDNYNPNDEEKISIDCSNEDECTIGTGWHYPGTAMKIWNRRTFV